MELQTPRLLLRPWEESDAEALYELAKDPDVGPAAGWNVHKDVEESREIIRTILSAPGTFAIFGRRDGQLRGSCGFLRVGEVFLSGCNCTLRLGNVAIELVVFNGHKHVALVDGLACLHVDRIDRAVNRRGDH